MHDRVRGCPGGCPASTSFRPTRAANGGFCTGGTVRRPACSSMRLKPLTLLTRFSAMISSTSQGLRSCFTATRGAHASLMCSTRLGAGAPHCLRHQLPAAWLARPHLPQKAYRAAFDWADIIPASTEDLELLFGPKGVQELLSHRSSAELVLNPVPFLGCPLALWSLHE